MLTAYGPTLLALLGTALMAVVIFAPGPVRGTVIASCAPPLSPVPARNDVAGWWTEPVSDAEPHEAPPAHEPPAWPSLFDPRLRGCDAAARAALASALGDVAAPWAAAILRGALDEEPDDAVRAAVVAALAQREGLA